MLQKPIEVFFPYSCEDKTLRDKLEIQLNDLKQQGVISSWHEHRQFLVGDELKKEIDRRVQAADIVLLLISPYFIAAEYGHDVKLPVAMDRHDAKEADIVHILIRPVSDWQEYSFPSYQVGGKAIAKLLDEDAFVKVTDGIRTAVKQLLANQQRQERLSSTSLPNGSISISAPKNQPLPLAKPQSFTINLTDRIPLEIIAIPGGKFWMGSPDGEGDDSERPRHEVTIAPFFMSKYPITQAQYQAVMGKNPSSLKEKGEKLPVGRVSWHEAIAFCQKLSSRGIHRESPENRQFSLPSEAQWEYACRAGTETPFYFGETISTEQANYDGNYVYGSGKKGTHRKHATDVGIFPPNAFGLYDTHGNVWEWCADYWHDNYEDAPEDGSAWLTASNASNRLLRGGSWIDYPRTCRSAFRVGSSPDDRYDFFGFRVVCGDRASGKIMSSTTKQG